MILEIRGGSIVTDQLMKDPEDDGYGNHDDEEGIEGFVEDECFQGF